MAISHELRDFFLKDTNNHIKLWDCSSKQKWPLHALVDKDSKSFNSVPIFPYKFSQNFCKKRECDFVLSQWRMLFQVADLKRRNFLELLDNNLNPIEPSNIKGGPQLQQFGYSNLLCARATRAIVNYTSIGKYYLRFFSREDFLCPYSIYPIETRRYILHKYKRFNKYQNSKRDTIAHFALFLQFNSSAFSFSQVTTYPYCIQHYNIFMIFFDFFSLIFFSFQFLLFFLHVVSVYMYIVTKQLPWSTCLLCVINC